MNSKLIAIDLFSGCGGLSEGLHQAGFSTAIAVEIEEKAVQAYKLNHSKVDVIQKNIREISSSEISDKLKGRRIHLLAGCPPCQGFSSIRRLNRAQSVFDARNDLVDEYVRLIEELNPYTIMMENVPALENYDKFLKAIKKLESLGYHPKYRIVNVRDYGVPQRRKRLVLVGSKWEGLDVAEPTNERKTVRDIIGDLESPELTDDDLHKIFPRHSEKVLKRIKLTPKNGGSRKDLPEKYKLDCHKKENVGFNDVYGRLRWDDYSTTITGGCLNPSKGRFLHPDADRCISAREAALLQSFPRNYKIPTDLPLTSIALLIGNALPPKFCYYQAVNIFNHLKKHLSQSPKANKRK